MANRTTEDYERQRNRQVAGIRSVLDYIIGLLFIIAGIASFVRFKGEALMIAFGVIAILYGGWRVYRGYKKTAV